MNELLHALGIEWKILIAQAINFALLLFVLQKFVYRPVMKMLDGRREGVRKTLENEEKAAAKLATAEEDREVILKEAHAEGNRIIEAARKDGESLVRRLETAAKEASAKMQADVERRHKDERVRLVAEVKGEIGTLIVTTIEKTLGDVFDARTQDKMVEQALAAIRNGGVRESHTNQRHSK